MGSTKKRGKFLVMTATLVPEVAYVEKEQLVKEFRQEVEEITIP